MTTTIRINGLDVEFSEQVPTRAGPRWWTRRIGPDSTSLRVKDIWNPCSDVLIDRETDLQPKDIGGLWSTSPLVPAVEVEKLKKEVSYAWSEGYNAALNETVKHKIPVGTCWEVSRARKVVEGIE